LIKKDEEASNDQELMKADRYGGKKDRKEKDENRKK